MSKKMLSMHAMTILCISAFFFSSCSNTSWSEDEEKFVKTYTEILVIREQNPDSASAEPLVAKTLKRYGFTYKSFQDRYLEYSLEAPKFRAMIDTARARSKREAK